MKQQNKKQSLQRIIGYLSQYKAYMIIAIIATIISVIFSSLVPKRFGEALTLVINGFIYSGYVDFEGLYEIVLTLVVLYIGSTLFTYIMQYLSAKLTADVVYNLRTDLRHKLKRLPVSYYDQNETGEIMSRITNDITVFGNNLGQIISQTIYSLLAVISIIIMMFSVNIKLSLIILVSVPITIFLSVKRGKKAQPFFKQKQATLGVANAYVEEYFTGYEIVNSYNQRENTLEAFKQINDRLCEESIASSKISSLIFPTALFVNNLTYAVVIIVGFSQVLTGKLAIGYVQSMIQYTKRLGQPIGSLANIANILQTTLAASDRVFEVLDELEEVNDESKELSSVKGQIDIRDLSFGYQADQYVLKHISCHINPKETVAIVGPTGSGKTTLINLLMRFYDATQGEILLDGVNITEYTKDSIRAKIGMVLQETWLFNGTILDNLKYGQTHASDEDAIQAAIQAEADTFIRQMPKGYHTILNEELDNISAGQKQLLTIARALVAQPDVYILDEATSNIDNKTEKAIQKAMDKMMAEKTAIVIAHRLSTIENADKILVIHHGELIEQGSHQALLQQKGFYYDLYHAQYTQ
ncbi:MAG: ABC transporter ATP-binding protein [Alcaligenaceae bacterium]|nr:ABC transporter ATP-binding protein [Alcaligenaceae bacterium]